MDKMPIDKKISILGVEVEEALDSLCRKWFFNDCKAYKKVTLDLTNPENELDKTVEEEAQINELRFVEKLIELQRLSTKRSCMKIT